MLKQTTIALGDCDRSRISGVCDRSYGLSLQRHQQEGAGTGSLRFPGDS